MARFMGRLCTRHCPQLADDPSPQHPCGVMSCALLPLFLETGTRTRPGPRLFEVNLGEGTAEVHAQVARPITHVLASALGAVIRPR